MTTDPPPDSPELRDEICRVGRSLYECEAQGRRRLAGALGQR